jgi:DNA-binding MarR family transcriptional regulator
LAGKHIKVSVIMKDRKRKDDQPDEFQLDRQFPIPLPDEAFGKLLQLVRTIQTGMQNIDNSHGLSGSQLCAVWQISAEPGVRVSGLAKALHIQPSTASNLLDKLAVRGLVRRDRGDVDTRVVRLFLTEQGRQLVKDLPGPMQGRLRRALQEVPEPILAGLITGLVNVLGLMGETVAAETPTHSGLPVRNP